MLPRTSCGSSTRDRTSNDRECDSSPRILSSRRGWKQAALADPVSILNVALDDRSYPILIGDGLLRQPDLIGKHVAAHDILIVSNATVAPLYLPLVKNALSASRITEVMLPDGESHKTLATVARIIDVLITNRYGRDCVVIALGGGVVGDTAGFAAACYQRGVGYIQVPTTLLAQVDSAVGGKTGVNHPGGKNLIGAFHQPLRRPRAIRPPWRRCRPASCGRDWPKSSSTG